jgi:hypothetical protein
VLRVTSLELSLPKVLEQEVINCPVGSCWAGSLPLLQDRAVPLAIVRDCTEYNN